MPAATIGPLYGYVSVSLAALAWRMHIKLFGCGGLAGRGFCLWLMDKPHPALASSAIVADQARCDAHGIGQAMASESDKPNRFKVLRFICRASSHLDRPCSFFRIAFAVPLWPCR
jgi:hypothetical protein